MRRLDSEWQALQVDKTRQDKTGSPQRKLLGSFERNGRGCPCVGVGHAKPSSCHPAGGYIHAREPRNVVMASSCGHLISDVTVIDCAALRSFLHNQQRQPSVSPKNQRNVRRKNRPNSNHHFNHADSQDLAQKMIIQCGGAPLLLFLKCVVRVCAVPRLAIWVKRVIIKFHQTLKMPST